MLNFMYNKLGSLLTGGPNVQYIQAKNLNLYFKNAKNPKYHFLNLTNITLLNFNIPDKTKNLRNFISRLDDLVDEFSSSIGFAEVKKTTYWYFRKTNEKDFVNNKW